MQDQVSAGPGVQTTMSHVLSLISTGFIVIAFLKIFILIEETKVSEDDEMERLYKSLEQASLSPLGDRRPSTKKELRKSFVKRCKNPSINEKLHKIRTLNSTLKVKNFRLWINSGCGARNGCFCRDSCPPVCVFGWRGGQ